MGKTYRIGRRYRKMQYASVVVNCLIVFAFYFIYRFLLEGLFPRFVGAPLALTFLLLGVLVAHLTLRYTDRYAASVRYALTDEGLIYECGKRRQLYRWEDFSGATLQEYQFRGVFPVEFQVGGQPMMLNQSVDGLCELTCGIFEQIAPYARLDPKLVKRAEDMRGVY